MMKKALLFNLFLGILNAIFAQESVIDKTCFINNADKIFVQLNKSSYTSGEKLYYKAYIDNYTNSSKSIESSILYFDIIDRNASQVLHWRSNVNGNTASGNIFLPDTLKSGVYYLRAYSNFNRNLKSLQAFSLPVIIIPINDKTLSTLILQGQPKAAENRIFIEGGSLVAGLDASLVFKLKGINAQESDSIYLFDGYNNLICKSFVNSDGTGCINFKPDKDLNYYIKCIDLQSDTLKINLPVAQNTGIIQHLIKNGNNSYSVEYQTNNDQYLSRGIPFRLLLEANGKVLINQMIDIKTNKTVIPIQGNTLPSGLCRLCLFNYKNELLCSQFYFFCNSSKDIDIHLSKDNYTKGEKVNINLVFKDNASSGFVDASVSVNEISPFEDIHPASDITCYFQMNSALGDNQPFIYPGLDSISGKHLIWSPDNNYIFDNNSNTDNHNFQAKEVGYYILKGRLTRKSNHQPLSGKIIMVSYVANSSDFEYTITNSNGDFCFFLDSTYDNRMIILQIADKIDDAYDIEWKIEPKSLDKFFVSGQNEYVLTSKQTSYLDRLRKAELVKRIYFSGEKSEAKSSGAGRASNFYIHPYYTVYPADYEALDNFIEIADNILQAVKFRRTQRGYQISMVMSETQEVKDENILVFLNGVPFFNMNYLAGLTSKDIERIEVRNSEFMYGDINFNGILSIYTVDKQLEPSHFNNAVLFYLNTVNLPSDEAVQAESGAHLPNIGQNVYWNPNVKLKTDETVDICFPAPDISSDYIINLNGIDQSGKPYSKSAIFKVR